MSTAHRIDVHQHVVPAFWAKELPTHGGDPSGTVIPQWSPQSAIDMMDSQEIATAILSLTAPGVARWYKMERREMARRVNEYTADLVAKQPGRFGNFATLPLPDVDGALRELEYSLDKLGAEFVEHNFDVRHVMRTICKSRTYQHSIKVNQWNSDDTLNYSHGLARRLPAEVVGIRTRNALSDLLRERCRRSFGRAGRQCFGWSSCRDRGRCGNRRRHADRP